MIARKPKELGGFQKLAPMAASKVLTGAKTQGVPGQPMPAPARVNPLAAVPRPFGR